MDKLKVLIVEDEIDLREMIGDALKEGGFDVYTAENGEEGLGKAREISPDVIVSDVIMPTKDGNQFLKELRETEWGKNVPFIVLTARGRMRDYFEVVGIDAFIEKPFKVEVLIQKINEALERSPQEPDEQSSGQDLRTSLEPVSGGKKQKSKSDIEISQDAEKVVQAAAIDIDNQQQKKKFMEKEEELKRKASISKISMGTSKKKVIIFGNDMDEFCELQKRFSNLDIASELVCTQTECLEEAKRIFPNLIIVRSISGEMNGEEIANKLKEVGFMENIPIIVCEDIGDREAIRMPNGRQVSVFVLNKLGKKMINRVNEILS